MKDCSRKNKITKEWDTNPEILGNFISMCRKVLKTGQMKITRQ